MKPYSVRNPEAASWRVATARSRWQRVTERNYIDFVSIINDGRRSFRPSNQRRSWFTRREIQLDNSQVWRWGRYSQFQCRHVNMKRRSSPDIADSLMPQGILEFDSHLAKASSFNAGHDGGDCPHPNNASPSDLAPVDAHVARAAALKRSESRSRFFRVGASAH